MKYYIFVKDGKIDGAGQCRQVTPGVINCEVSEEVYRTFSADPRTYVAKEGQIIENPNYATEVAADERAQRAAVLQAQLNALDLRTIRALRAMSAGVGTSTDKTKLEELESEAAHLRTELADCI